MKHNVNVLNTVCEVAMMTGNVMFINSEEGLTYCLDYIAKTITGEDNKGAELFKTATQYLEDTTKPVGFSTSRLMGMPVINVIMKDDGEELDMTTRDGVLCYVLNLADEWCSEMGYCFFEKRGENYHRIS